MVDTACFSKLRACRLCRHDRLEDVIALGEQALTGRFPRAGEPEPPVAPLSVVRCLECGLVQLEHSVDMREMFTTNYGYRSNINRTMRDHLTGIADAVGRVADLSNGDIVLDIGCNDGTLLGAYPGGKAIRVGIDPLAGQFLDAYPPDMIALASFFDAGVFLEASSGRKAKAVTSVAMFYDVEDPNAFVRDIASILTIDGIWVLEQSYLPSMLEINAFDTICHEHLEYYALHQINRVMEANGMRVFDVELNDCNGGSFRVFVCREDGPYPENRANVGKLLALEEELALDTRAPYDAFRKRVLNIRERLRDLVIGEAERGKRIYVYGASTKGNVILQFCGLDHRHIQGAAERNLLKCGERTPATGIPIISEQQARAQSPDYFLALPWHFKEEFLVRERDFLRNGGRFIFPLPEVEVV